MNQVDKDTMKILQEMQAEGEELPDAAKGLVETSDEETDDTEEKPEEEESNESDQSDEDSEGEQESEASDKEDDDSEGDTSEDTQDRTPQKRERPVLTWAMVKNANKEVERLQKELEEAGKPSQAQDKSDAIDAEIQALAEDTKADPKALEKLLALMEKRLASKFGLSEQERAIIKQSQQRLLDEQETKAHQAEVTKVKTFFPELKKDKEALQRLERLAYTEKYKNTPMTEVFLENREKILGRKTEGTRSSESSRGGSQKSSQVRDLEAIVKEGRWSELSDEEFAKLSDKLGVITPNRIFTPVSETKKVRLRRR